MPSFDSIVVGEDWISEHYFTTDSTKESFQSEVLKLRKQWDEQAKEGDESVLKRFLSERGTFQVELAELVEEPSIGLPVYHKVREALGFKGTSAELTSERAGTTVRVPNVWTSHNGDLLFLESRPVESLEDLLDSAKAIDAGPSPHRRQRQWTCLRRNSSPSSTGRTNRRSSSWSSGAGGCC